MTGFISALGGLRVHQSWIDVIGNNLANSNTPGFKSSRALFSDLLSQTIRAATGPSGNIGGTNPLQIGLGVQLSHVDRRLQQGALSLTGRNFDLALLGGGYFALSTGTETLYSRVGAFGLDEGGTMVDLRTGYRVLDATGQPFTIDTSAVIPPRATSLVGITGNLPAVVTGPLAEELTSASAMVSGTSATMSGTASGPFNVPVGETWTMEVIVDGGAPELVSIAGTGSMTAQDVATQISAQLAHATASVGTNGEVVITGHRTGTRSTIEVNAGATNQDLKALLGLGDHVQGTETPATPATDLNELASNVVDYQQGDVIEISGTDQDGSPVVASFVYGVDGTTVGDLVAFLDNAFTQSAVSFQQATGQISILAGATGEASLSLAVSDASSQTGRTSWAEHFFSVTTEGAGPDQVTTSTEVFDGSGTAHVMTLDFTREADGSWTMVASVPASEGTVINGTIPNIRFNENGSILSPTAGTVTVQFGSGSPQSLTLDLGTSGQFGGVTQFGNPASLIVDEQDGYGAGELASMQVNAQGVIEGFFTNGQTQDLGSFGVAVFANEAGLEELGDNYLRESANSGVRTLGPGHQSGAGEVVGGAIEGSNVDTAQEFVNLIQAQRGFQANARVITVQDELLAEVVNIV